MFREPKIAKQPKVSRNLKFDKKYEDVQNLTDLRKEIDQQKKIIDSNKRMLEALNARYNEIEFPRTKGPWRTRMQNIRKKV